MKIKNAHRIAYRKGHYDGIPRDVVRMLDEIYMKVGKDDAAPEETEEAEETPEAEEIENGD